MTRKNILKAQRIVVKIGTSSLILPNGKINLSNIDELAFVLSDLNNKGYEVILVTSGAIGVGLNVLGMDKRPKGIADQQALASIGQVELMSLYTQMFRRYSQKVSPFPQTYYCCSGFPPAHLSADPLFHLQNKALESSLYRY